jgi:hypothetical protein
VLRPAAIREEAVSNQQNMRMLVPHLLLVLALAACGREASQAVTPSSGSSATFVQIVAGEALILGHVVPLTDAISDLQINRVKMLLEAGADPNVREENATSWPPLAFAMRGSASTEGMSESDHNAMREIMNLLLAHGADPNIRWCDADRTPCNERTGVTPLMYAASLGNDEFTDILLKKGADPSLRDWNGLTAADYSGTKPSRRPASWCLAPILKKLPGDYAPQPILDDARWFVNPAYLERQRAPDDAAIIEALTSSTDRSVVIVKDERVCEAAAVAYARYRMMEPSEPKPRPVVPVAVVRAGPAWIVDDQADGGGRGIFDKSWRILGWWAPPD